MKRPVISAKTLNTFPIDPVADFTFEENFIERTQIFHELFTLEDDRSEVAVARLQNERANKVSHVLN